MKRVRTVLLTVSAAVLLLSGLFLARMFHEGGSADGGKAGRLRRMTAAPVSPDSTIAVRVAVFNGCGRPGICVPFVRRLRGLGFDVVNGMGGNADSFDYPFSVVVDRRGAGTKAGDAARALGISRVISQRTLNPFLIEDVAVIIGRDWNTYIFTTEDDSE